MYIKIYFSIQLYDLGSFGRGCYSKGKPEFLTIENENLIVINNLIQLSHEDSIYLLLLKIIEIHNEDKILSLLDCWNLFCLLYENESIIFPIRFIVYYNLRKNKLIPKCGLSTGCHFLIYKSSPELEHSAYLLYINNNNLNYEEIQSLIRISTNIKKNVMIAEVDKTNLINKFCDEKDIINILDNVLVNFHYIKVLFIYLEMYIKRLYLTKINHFFLNFFSSIFLSIFH